jgi:hypothetical protein
MGSDQLGVGHFGNGKNIRCLRKEERKNYLEHVCEEMCTFSLFKIIKFLFPDEFIGE